MNSRFVIRIAAFVAVAALPATAFAQAVPGAEIVGQPVQVTTNGVTNTVTLNPAARRRLQRPAVMSSTVRGAQPTGSFASATAPPRNAGLTTRPSRPASR